MASKFLLAALLLAPNVLGRAIQTENVNEVALDERAVAIVCHVTHGNSIYH